MGLRLSLTLLKNCWNESLYNKLFIINIWVLEFVLHFKLLFNFFILLCDYNINFLVLQEKYYDIFGLWQINYKIMPNLWKIHVI